MKHARRTDANTLTIGNDDGLPITLFARDDVPVEPRAIAEARRLGRLRGTVGDLKSAGFLGPDATLERIVLTPDFHRGDGRGIPIGTCLASRGFVIPKAVGSDICCGMRFVMTDVSTDELAGIGAALDRRLRYIFFEGGRDIAMTPAQRRALFRDGLPGLFEAGGAPDGHDEGELRRVHSSGVFDTRAVDPCLDDFIAGSGGASRDDQIGSIGGGNHFVELQTVDEILERRTAYRWGLRKGYVAIMAHSGSVSIGARIGQAALDKARSSWPDGIARPDNDFFMLPTDGDAADLGAGYLSAMGNGANFAVANRLYLTAMAARAVSDCLGRDIATTLVHDAPHNLIWARDDGGWLHRKGACPATLDPDDPEFPDGHPVIVPGSMGTPSWLLRGLGSVASLCSAAHGAGRIRPRGVARRRDPDELAQLRIVTGIDPSGLRRDIAKALNATLMEEAPSCYKDPGPVIDTLQGAGIAAAVARVSPVLSVKG